MSNSEKIKAAEAAILYHPIKKACIESGIPSVNILLEITGMSSSTLARWVIDRPLALECLILGAAHKYAHRPS